MIIDDIIKAYEFINERTVFTNLEKPILYEIPKIKGIHHGEYGKNINEVYPNALIYIVYHLHYIDYSFLIESIVALFYYYKFRKRNKMELNKEFEKIKNHYSKLNEKKEINYKVGKCVYLIEINIGSEKIYKIGKTDDFNTRMKNITQDINSKYEFVSTSINPLKIEYTSNADILEKQILDNLKKDHKFYFNGHTESFKNIEIINIFNKYIEKSKILTL